MSTYLTKNGDSVDFVAWKFYGRQDRRVVEQVLDANPGLADLGPVLDAGVLISLPEIADTQDANTGVKLWD